MVDLTVLHLVEMLADWTVDLKVETMVGLMVASSVHHLVV
jgi:hypothetical protein